MFAVKAIWYTFALTLYELWNDDYSDLASENYKNMEAKIVKSVSAEYFMDIRIANADLINQC